MKTNKKYAIRCETEKEARELVKIWRNQWYKECSKHDMMLYKDWLFYTAEDSSMWWKYITLCMEGYTKGKKIISYQEAKEKWLLEDTILLDSTERSEPIGREVMRLDSKDNLFIYREPNNNEQLIEEIIEKMSNVSCIIKWDWVYIDLNSIKKILVEYLSK